MENIYVMKFSDFRAFAENYYEEHNITTFNVIPFFRDGEAYVTVQGITEEAVQQLLADGMAIDLRPPEEE